MFDGVSYNWNTAMKIMKIVSKLKPDHLIWNPYKSRWDIIESISFHKRFLKHFRSPVGLDWESTDRWSLPISGWHLDEPIITTTKDNEGSKYFIYDIEHWNPWCSSQVKLDDFSMFNRQVGLPDNFRPDWWR
jgi:hypothetical protein